MCSVSCTRLLLGIRCILYYNKYHYYSTVKLMFNNYIFFSFFQYIIYYNNKVFHNNIILQISFGRGRIKRLLHLHYYIIICILLFVYIHGREVRRNPKVFPRSHHFILPVSKRIAALSCPRYRLPSAP